MREVECFLIRQPARFRCHDYRAPETPSNSRDLCAIEIAAAFTLEAETSGGHVSSEIPVTPLGKMERGRLSGTVNGGGKLLYLHTSGGHIEIRQR